MRLLLALALLCGFAAPASAQLRTIPEAAKQGEMRHVQEMQVELDGAPRRLAPGAQIRDQSNRAILPTQIAPGARVRYLLDEQGMVKLVWILTPDEAAAQDKRE